MILLIEQNQYFTTACEPRKGGVGLQPMANSQELRPISLTKTGIEMALSRVNLSQIEADAYNGLVEAIEDHAARQCSRHFQAHDIAQQVVDEIIDQAIAGRTIAETVAGLTKFLKTTGPL